MELKKDCLHSKFMADAQVFMGENLRIIFYCITNNFNTQSALRGRQNNSKKKVLILYSYGSDLPVQKLFTSGLQGEFAQSSFKIEYIYEYLEAERYDAKGEYRKILYLFLFRDAAGNVFIPGDALKEMYKVARVPIYGSVSSFVGQGSIGGVSHCSTANKSSQTKKSCVTCLYPQVCTDFI